MDVNGVTMPVPNPVGMHRADPETVLQKGENRGTEAAAGTPGQKGEVSASQAEKLKRERAAQLEELVLKPNALTFEERMKQVISLDDMKRLLYLYNPYKMREWKSDAEVSRGTLIDMKS